ncbi:hypothetical protein Z950_305 [Sulfitobacter mediterraneus KCTC 32188]|nr:hypothetical protein Z950_305 [Sulfitobacter mediterraneus KCTC 32188]
MSLYGQLAPIAGCPCFYGLGGPAVTNQMENRALFPDWGRAFRQVWGRFCPNPAKIKG